MSDRLDLALQTADLRFYQTVRSGLRWLREERAAKTSLPLKLRMGMWRHGFLSDSVVLYDLAHHDPRDYVSDYQLYTRCARINTWNALYDHKLALRAFLLAMGFRQATTLAYIYEGRVLAEPLGPDARYLRAGELQEHLEADGSETGYVVKPEDGQCGKGVFLLLRREDGWYRQRGRSIEPFDFDRFLSELGDRDARGHRSPNPTLIERRLTQAAFWRGLFPESANSLRLLTLWTPGEAAPFVAGAAQRIGTADTVPTDNFTGGGISCPIDRASGRLGAGRMHPLKGREPGRRFTHHPDTGAQLEGAVLPGWDRITDAVLRAASGLPFNRMAGWDVLVDADGEPVLLEANANGGHVDVMQIHGGLLADPQVRHFYETVGVVGAPGEPQPRPHVEQVRWDGLVDQVPSAARKLLGTDRYHRAWASYRWLKHERRGPAPLPLEARLGMWRRGFYAESALLYDFPRHDPREYVSDLQNVRMSGRINAWDGLYDHKLGLRAYLLVKGFAQPETVAYVYAGRILAEPLTGLAAHISAEQLEQRLRSAGDGAAWVVKPEDGRRGLGVFLLEQRDGRLLERRGQETTAFDVGNWIAGLTSGRRGGPAGAMLIERRLEQGAFWRELYPESANSMRLLTLWTPDEPAPFIAAAVQRIGTADTVPTDNWSGGGISAPIDGATGRLGKGRMHPLKARGLETRFSHHPDTGATIEGALIPGWTGIVETVLAAAASVPFNRMAGWDVLVDARGRPIILEANSNSDLNLLQIHGGLLANPASRRFYEAVGAVP